MKLSWPVNVPKPSAFFCITLTCFLSWLLPMDLVSRLAVLSNNFVTGWPSFHDLLTLITYQFAHANFAHFVGNFCFAAPFAIYAERRLGRRDFLNLWLSSGIMSALFFIISGLGSMPVALAWTVGMPVSLIGASGAISGVMAFACLDFSKHNWWSRILGYSVLSWFFVNQIVMMCMDCSEPSGVAHSGHVGGIIAAAMWMAIRKDSK